MSALTPVCFALLARIGDVSTLLAVSPVLAANPHGYWTPAALRDSAMLGIGAYVPVFSMDRGNSAKKMAPREGRSVLTGFRLPHILRPESPR
ncbi:hypothetical protein [Rugamonas rubra]|uniref:hypothetical protein n=1 Tax=Rugamonas rubra TaxID=758825 RepID=UPI0011145398|nr:hypothetical protein [Rugamonas rubra]